ncbi:MAG: alkaline phosphatase family protein [Acidobacteriota bacterium]
MPAPNSRRPWLLRGLILAFALSIAAGIWASVRSAGPGEVLVLSDRVIAGPIRLLSPPWAPHRIVPRHSPIRARTALKLGEGSDWPVEVEALVSIDPSTVSDDARGWLLGDAAAALKLQVDSTLESTRTSLSIREVLARPATLTNLLRGPLRERLPRGLELVGLKASLVATPEQARSLAQSALAGQLRKPVARVLYLGLDGADWEVILPMVSRGELPAFARLLREGVRAELTSYEPMISPLLWTTALTGRGPDAHGICDFTVVKPDGEHLPITTQFRKVPALWEILATQNQASAFSGFWATHPAEEVPGVLLSDIVGSQLAEGAAPKRPLASGSLWPADALDSIWTSLQSTSTISNSIVAPLAPKISSAQWEAARLFWLDKSAQKTWKEANKKGRRRPPDAFLLRLAAEMHNLETITTSLLARRELTIVGAYFEAIDLAGHYYQHLAPPAYPLAPPEERELYSGTIEAVYRLQDQVLGRLLTAAVADTVVIVHSDHGFAWGERRPKQILPFTEGQPVEWHRHTGMFLAWGPGVRRGQAVSPVSLYDIAPTLLALRGMPASDAMEGSVRADLFEPDVAAQLPSQRIPSWDVLVPPRRFGSGGDDSEEAQEQLLETLRGLGYVDDAPSKPRQSASAALSGDSQELMPGIGFWRNLSTWFMNENRFEEAEETLLKANATEQLPKNYWLLSEARAARGDLPGAIKALDDGFSVMPDRMSASNLVWLIELHLKRQDTDAAIKSLAAYRSVAAGSPSTLELADGLIAHAKGDLDGARQHYIAALKRNAREVRAAERFGEIARTPAERASLLPFLQQGLHDDPRIEQYWKMLGLLMLENNDLPGALRALHEAVELEPRDHSLRLTEAQVAVRAGRLDYARSALEALAREGTELAAVWLNLGSLRAQASDSRGAVAAWRQAQKLGADSPALQQAIADAERRR